MSGPTAGKPIEWAPFEITPEARAEREKWTKAAPGFKRYALPIIAILFGLDILGMLVFKLRGGDATALLGGTVGIIMVFVAIGAYGKEGFEKLSDHARAGFMFGVRIFAPVFLVASFFFMGSPGTAKAIFGEGAKGLLFDLGQAMANAVPLSRIPDRHCPGRGRRHYGFGWLRVFRIAPGGNIGPGPGGGNQA